MPGRPGAPLRRNSVHRLPHRDTLVSIGRFVLAMHPWILFTRQRQCAVFRMRGGKLFKQFQGGRVHGVHAGHIHRVVRLGRMHSMSKGWLLPRCRSRLATRVSACAPRIELAHPPAQRPMLVACCIRMPASDSVVNVLLARARSMPGWDVQWRAWEQRHVGMCSLPEWEGELPRSCNHKCHV